MKTFIAILLFALGVSSQASIIDLSGTWELRLDPDDAGIRGRWWSGHFDQRITLPGTLAGNGIGEPLKMQAVLPIPKPEELRHDKGITFGRGTNNQVENKVLLHLYARNSHLGPAWYHRIVDIPGNWRGKDVELELERVIWETEAWVNGTHFGAEDSLVAPHRYEIGGALHPGRNDIVLRVDNRRQAAIGNPHAYTDETQTIWNGVIGKIQLSARDKLRIDRLEIRPGLERKGVRVTMALHNGTGKAWGGTVTLRARPENFHGREYSTVEIPISISPGDHEQTVFYAMDGGCELWSEFNPKLYRMEASLAGHDDMAGADYGMREFKAAGRRFTINGQPTFLRGTVESCVFPKNGYPDMTGPQWKKMFLTAKACGLNHFRFHTWCPPEVAFEMADRYGIYLQVELPDWSFHIGQDRAATEFFRKEGERMIREYGNHPSWVMFTMGNELKGDYAALDDLENHFRALDPQLLCSCTTYPSEHGKKPDRADDYYISLQTTEGRVRGQFILNDTAPNTVSNYSAAVAAVTIPLVSHEVGQYCVYPNVAEIPKYNGALRPVALEAICADLEEKGRLREAPAYARDSGKLAVLLYKEEVERALRTTNQAGFQLLAMNDFPGQGTSTVGPFDAFWDRKGFVTPADFHKFSGPVVPLAMMSKRIFENDEPFDATVSFANFGPSAITNAHIAWSLKGGGKTIGHGEFAATIPLGQGFVAGKIRQSLAKLTRPARLKLSVSIPGTTIANDWDIWVYPQTEALARTNEILTLHSFNEECRQALRDGRNVLLLPLKDDLKSPLAAAFTPVFWNPVMFPNQPGTMGAMINSTHPIFADFPTDPWTNWQWWELLHRATAIDLDALPAPVDAPLRFVDKFNRNAMPAALFEAAAGAGRLVVCALDISSDLNNRLAARQLRRSILKYMGGGHFHPRSHLSMDDLDKLFRAR